MSYQLTETLRLVWNWGNFVHEDTKPRLVDVAKGKTLATLTGHTDYIRGAFMLGPDKIVTWSNDCSIRIWALDGTCLHTLTEHSDYVCSVVAVNDSCLASTAGDDRLIVWSLQDGTSRTIDNLGTDLSISLSGPARVLLRADQRALRLIDVDGAEPVTAALEEPTSFLSTHAFDETTFLVIDDSGLTRIRWQDGTTLCAIDVADASGAPWRCDAFLALEGGRALIACHFYSKPGRVVFRLYDMDKAALVAECDISGGDVLWMRANTGGAPVTVQLKDYRRLTLDAATLRPLKTSGVTSYQADGFCCYAPEEEPSSSMGQPMSVTWLDPHKATCAIFDDNDEAVDMAACGVLADASTAIAFESHWRVYSPGLVGFENLSKEAFAHLYPGQSAAAHWAACKSGRLPALAREAAQVLGCTALDARMAARQLEEAVSDRLYFAPGQDGLFLAYSPKSHSIWQLNEAGTCFNLAVKNEPGAFVGHTLLRGLSGQVMRLGSDGLRPAHTVSGAALFLHQEAFLGNWNVHLRANGHLLIRQGTGVTVLDSQTGETLAGLESGHGMGMWGVLAGGDGPIITWSRSSLRSWDRQTYAPLVEVKDPEDWGPGYEFICQSPSGHAVFTPGDCTYDSRIMIWDGLHTLAVYAGHAPNDVAQITALTSEIFLSKGINHGGTSPVRLWRCPCHVFDEPTPPSQNTGASKAL